MVGIFILIIVCVTFYSAIVNISLWNYTVYVIFAGKKIDLLFF